MIMNGDKKHALYRRRNPALSGRLCSRSTSAFLVMACLLATCGVFVFRTWKHVSRAFIDEGAGSVQSASTGGVVKNVQTEGEPGATMNHPKSMLSESSSMFHKLVADGRDKAMQASLRHKVQTTKDSNYGLNAESHSTSAIANGLALPPVLVPYDGRVEPAKRYKAFWFTMDSLQTYIDNAARGGPAGEIVVRQSLTAALRELNVDVEFASSDAQFAEMTNHDIDRYDLFFFDPWTYVGPGWIARPFLKGREQRTFLVSFFGMKTVPALNIPLHHVLTPYPSIPGNTFTGFIMEPRWAPRNPPEVMVPNTQARISQLPIIPIKKNQGIIWGKIADYFVGMADVLRAVASAAELHAVVDISAMNIPNVVIHGHLTKEEWSTLLAESKFLLGLGDPLSGPSALDAIAAGCMFINPHYDTPKEEVYMSQHPFLEEYVGSPYVCGYKYKDADGAKACVVQVMQLDHDLTPFNPPEMSKTAVIQRVSDVVKPALSARPKT